jgi:hypothetical protein
VNTNLNVKTAQAADVAGVGYEGFRSWLKRGLLKETGLLPKFYAREAPAELADAKRWRWQAFGFADLCSFRLTKILLDAGLPWERVSPIVSDQGLWQSHHHDSAAGRYLAVFQNGSQWTLYPSAEALADDLNTGTIRSDWMTLIDLHELRKSVVFRNRAAALRAVADDTKRTSHIFARTGSNLLTPGEEADRRLGIEKLARELGELAVEAEQGGGSYKEFETLLIGLHKKGKFPDPSAVSAVAAAFTD